MAGWQQAVETTVTGLGYELVDCVRSSQGLLVVYIDRLPAVNYPTGPGDVVTVDDCERVTRQLQHVLEVEGCDYSRLEVSSPGVDRPLKQAGHYRRFVGEQIDLTLKQPFQGRRKYRGVLRDGQVGDAASGADEEGFELVFQDGPEDKVLGFTLAEVREARLVPVLNFKGRNAQHRKSGPAGAAVPSGVDEAGPAESGGHEE